MRILDWEDFLLSGLDSPAAMTIGVFDGVHRGHQVLLGKVREKVPDLLPVAVTFCQNPKSLTRPHSFGGNIVTLRQKCEYIAAEGIEILILIDFSRNFGKMSGKEFIDLLQDRGKLRYLAVGSDFRCGYRLDTDTRAIALQNGMLGIPTEIVSHLMMGKDPVSSSRIRAEILSGDLVEASKLLGRNFVLDLSGLPTTPGDGWIGFEVHADQRIAPPDGRYPVSMISGNGQRTEQVIAIVDGVVRVPDQFDIERIEFTNSGCKE